MANTHSLNAVEIQDLKKQFIDIAKQLAEANTAVTNCQFIPVMGPAANDEITVTIRNGRYEIEARICAVPTMPVAKEAPPEALHDHIWHPSYGGDMLLNKQNTYCLNPLNTVVFKEALYEISKKFSIRHCMDTRSDAGNWYIVILRDVYQDIYDTFQDYLTKNDQIRDCLLVTGTITPEQVANMFLREYEELCKDILIYPLCTPTSAICLHPGGSISAYQASQELFTHIVPKDSKRLSDMELFRFTDRDERWLWVNPTALISSVFNLSIDDVDNLTEFTPYMDFLKKTFISAVDEYNKTTEDANMLIKQRYRKDCLITCAVVRPSIEHYKHMYEKEIEETKKAVAKLKKTTNK